MTLSLYLIHLACNELGLSRYVYLAVPLAALRPRLDLVLSCLILIFAIEPLNFGLRLTPFYFLLNHPISSPASHDIAIS
jgi:hypothetical protein